MVYSKLASIYLSKAVSLHLGDNPHPVVTRYELGTLVYQLYLTKKYRGQTLRISKNTPLPQDLSKLINTLVERGVLFHDPNLPKKRVFRILGRRDASAEDIACTVDPFAFVSHLSAMDYHGLTDRLPRPLYLSSPVPRIWKALALKRMEKDCDGFFDDYLTSGFPLLQRTNMNKVAQRSVDMQGISDYHGAYRNVRGKVFRVATIGRTFLDMLREPTRCGGITHVIQVFQLHAQSHLKLIVAEIDQHGRPIDKIRAGYILDERCSLSHPLINKWLTYVQRGGSRKLDPAVDYSSEYSEKWSLSINVVGA